MPSAEDNQIIADLARENVTLRRRVADLEDTAQRRASWLYKAKQAAGYGDSVSFDVVWADALKALQNAKQST